MKRVCVVEDDRLELLGLRTHLMELGFGQLLDMDTTGELNPTQKSYTRKSVPTVNFYYNLLEISWIYQK